MMMIMVDFFLFALGSAAKASSLLIEFILFTVGCIALAGCLMQIDAFELMLFVVGSCALGSGLLIGYWAREKREGIEWFSEKVGKGSTFRLKIDDLLHEETSEYQDIKLFKNQDYGTVVSFNNVIQEPNLYTVIMALYYLTLQL